MSKVLTTTVTDDFKTSFDEYSVAFNQRMLYGNLDGLKPIHRRILFGTRQIAPANGKTRKSARIVGHIVGTLSPHGDASCYETMTKLVQKFALNIPFLDGQGKL